MGGILDAVGLLSGQSDWKDSWRQLALTFDGYAEFDDCGTLANGVGEHYESFGVLPELSLREARGCLFYEQRRYHHFGWSPSEEAMAYIEQLIEVIKADLLDFALVESVDEAVMNVVRFNREIEYMDEMVSQLSQFRHWYYIESRNQFGPSKYIGYKDMDTFRYARGWGKDGRETEKALANWFVQIPVDTDQFRALRRQLESNLGEFGKKLRSNARVHILR